MGNQSQSRVSGTEERLKFSLGKNMGLMNPIKNRVRRVKAEALRKLSLLQQQVDALPRGRGNSIARTRMQQTLREALEKLGQQSPTRRLMATAEDAPSAWFLFAPILVILMLVVMVWRKPVRALFSRKDKSNFVRDTQTIEPSSRFC